MIQVLVLSLILIDTCASENQACHRGVGKGQLLIDVIQNNILGTEYH